MLDPWTKAGDRMGCAGPAGLSTDDARERGKRVVFLLLSFGRGTALSEHSDGLRLTDQNKLMCSNPGFCAVSANKNS